MCLDQALLSQKKLAFSAVFFSWAEPGRGPRPPRSAGGSRPRRPPLSPRRRVPDRRDNVAPLCSFLAASRISLRPCRFYSMGGADSVADRSEERRVGKV